MFAVVRQDYRPKSLTDENIEEFLGCSGGFEWKAFTSLLRCLHALPSNGEPSAYRALSSVKTDSLDGSVC